MAQVEIRVLVCDGCGREDSTDRPVTSHEIAVDGNPANREACGRCWNKALAGLASVFGEAFDPARAPSEIVCLDCNPIKSLGSRAGLGAHRARLHAEQAMTG